MGWSGSASQGFGGRSTFDSDISKWDTGKVTTMGSMFSSAFLKCVQPRHWELEYRKGDKYERVVCFITLLRSTKTLGVGTQRK